MNYWEKYNLLGKRLPTGHDTFSNNIKNNFFFNIIIKYKNVLTIIIIFKMGCI